ncbi:MAG: ComEC/Rec2 family competence protein [Rickettsiaceae bacterium]|nr:ComEC/Rec2 family competence protein [Rickettsiaceae bacterium]
MNILEKEYHHLSLWYFVSFIFGIVFIFQSGLGFSSYSIFTGLVVTFVMALVAHRKGLLFSFSACCMLFFFIGMTVSHLRISSIKTKPISKIIISEVVGTITQIKPSALGTQVTLENVNLTDMHLEKVRINVASKLLVDIVHGDVVKLKAKLFPLQSGVLPGTYDFGFYMYMSGIEASGYALTSLEIVGNKQGAFDQYIQNIRHKTYDRLIKVLGTEKGNFAAAILIGETKAIPKKVANDMRNSGIAHILSVSGLHLSLVAMIFFVTSRMLLNCSNYLAYNINIKIAAACISIIGSFAYLQISGSNIAAMRAFIMTFIFIISIMLGRTPYPLRSVMIAAFVILVFLPEYVLHPSFQLSFAAVLCLISGYEFYIKHQRFLGHSKGIISSIKLYVFANIYSSFLASIVTAPFVIYHFYKFANYSVFMNLIAVPLMSFFMMPLALLSVIIMPMGLDFWVLKSLGWFIGLLVESASYIVSLPGALWVTGNISAMSLLVFTFGFFWICLWQTAWRFIGIAIMSASLIMMFLCVKPDLIYDHTLKAVGIRNSKGELEIYSYKSLPLFTSDYWASWYGQKAIEQKQMKITARDQIFKLSSGQTVSFNYWKCTKADVQIITSKKLKCPSNEGLIDNKKLMELKQILLYCGNNSSCELK